MAAPEPAYSPPAAPQRAGCILASLTTLIMSACAILFVASILAPLLGAAGPGVAAVAMALLVALLLLLALALVRAPRLRAAVQAWLLALPLTLLMLPAALLPPVEAQTAAIMRIVLIGGYLAGLWFVLRWRFPLAAHPNRAGLAFAALLAVVPALPWLIWGALGSFLDILLALGAAGLFAIAAGLLVTHVYLRPLANASASPSLFGGGAVIGMLLLLLGLNIGVGGQMPLLLPLLPALGWPAAAVAGIGREGLPRRRALALFVMLAVAPPLLLADPDTLWVELLAQGREGIYWALSAAFAAMLLALATAGFAPALRDWLDRAPRRALAGALTLWTAAAIVYAAVGQPGLHGDRVFVILKDQADLSQARATTDYQARRRAVYATLTEHAERTQAALRADLDRVGVRYQPYYLVNALEVEAGWPVRLWLMTRSDVDRVVPNPVLRPLPEPIAVETGDTSLTESPTWNLTLIGADRVWRDSGIRGEGIIVGVMDSGVQWDHPELRDSYRGLNADGSVSHEYNWYDPWEGATAPVDYSGHGTYTLSAAVGNQVGVAPDATWIGCVNLARNVGNPARYLDCMQFMLAPFPPGGNPLRDGDPARGADVTNNSWGCPQDLEGCDANTLLAAAEALRAAGMFTVAAAGNDGPACSTLQDPLALYDAVFTVGAVGRDREIAAFSSVGPVTSDGSGRIKPDIAAPGANVLAAAPGNGYMVASGTSIAAPHISGVVALLWAANPALIGDIEHTEAILRDTATPGAPPDAMAAGCISDANISARPNIIYGAGIVDADAAVRAALGR